MLTLKAILVNQNPMVLFNVFNQNSFSRFLDILKKKKQKKKHFFSCTIRILDHIVYGKVKRLMINCKYVVDRK